MFHKKTENVNTKHDSPTLRSHTNTPAPTLQAINGPLYMTNDSG